MSVLDLSDILRAEVVLIVSALDHFVHELVRLGMIESYANRRRRTKQFLKFGVTLHGALSGINSPSDADWLDTEIRSRHGWISFQHPDNIAQAIRLVSHVELWNEVSARLGKPPQDIKTQLRLIIDRRNKIAHEADINPAIPGERWPVDEIMVNEALAFVSDVAESIYDVVTSSP